MQSGEEASGRSRRPKGAMGAARGLGPLLLLLSFLALCAGDLERTFTRCCDLGAQWARKADAPNMCSEYPGPVYGIATEQQGVCLSTVAICCLNSRRRTQCERGMVSAGSGGVCTSATESGGEYHKDCCEACKLGTFSGSMNMGCGFDKFSFGYPWDEAYRTCCMRAQSTTTSESFPSTAVRDRDKLIPNPNVDGMCDMIPGLCAHVCISEPGSFRCACRDGFSLMADGRTCQQNDLPDRCKSQNPCEQICLDTGFSVECSCSKGYTLRGDKTSCEDIDECALGTDVCTQNNLQCRNEPGGYSCINTDGSVTRPLKPGEGIYPVKDSTICPTGYHYNLKSKVCDDIDECEVSPRICGSLKDCQNTIGSFTCTRIPMEDCPPGYEFNITENTCTDVNECEEGLSDCDPHTEFCLNTEGNFTCQRRTQKPSCPAGYKLGKVPGSCEDINECEEDTYLCNPNTEVCINEPGAYRCGPKVLQDSKVQLPQSCPAGFKSHPTQDNCVDIDECSESSEPPCDDNQICENQHGGYECKCKPGFQFDTHLRACVDINECQTNQHDCTASQRCDNTIGSYQCIRFTSCGTGYTLNVHLGRCEDDDECTLGTDNCRHLGPTFQCRNTHGSFRCEKKRCSEKQILLNTGECRTVSCPPGLEPGYHGNCIDINECERPNVCRRNQRCINTKGSYRCVSLMNCPGGFELNEAGTQCIDIDECVRSTHECTSQQTCHNRNGGYTCKCPPGHIVNEQKECEDIDECSYFNEQVCPSNSVCENNIGSYHCKCNDGFKPVVGENTCADVDECLERPGICHQKCVNVWGSYRCLCEPGYALQTDDRTCRDVDECEEFKDRNLCIGICVNEPGSYKCQCPDGYRLGSDGRTCQDINECASGTPCTGPSEVCVNTLGSFRCAAINCPPGFSKDPAHRNRCKRDSFYCLEGDLDCFRRPSSYSYNFIAFVSNIIIPPSGHLDLFTMRGLVSSTTVNFVMNVTDVRAPLGVSPATNEYFLLRRHYNQGVIALVRPIKGPQEIELQLVMEIHQSGYSSRAIAKLFMYVSEYEF